MAPIFVVSFAVSALVVVVAAALDENFVDFAALVGIGFACQNLLELSLFLLHENCFPLGCAFFSDRSPPPHLVCFVHMQMPQGVIVYVHLIETYYVPQVPC